MERKWKKNLGLIIFFLGIALIIASITIKILISPQIKTTGLKEFLLQNELRGKLLFAAFELAFTLGAGFIMIGSSILSDAGRKRVWLFSWMLIFAAVVLSFFPVVFTKSYDVSYFTVAGILIFITFSLFSWFWYRNRRHLDSRAQIAADIKMAGYFFFFLALSELSSLLGIPYLAIYPEKVIQFNLIPDMVTQAKIVMLMFVIGWIFTAIAYYYQNRITPRKK